MKYFCCVCAPRSGSTLLTRMLNAHSKIAAPFEIPVAKFSFGKDGENISIDKVVQIADFIGIDPAIAVNDPKALCSKILEFEGKQALVIKEPANTMHLPRLRLEFGHVPLIHIVRDVRQVMQSKAFKSSNVSELEAADIWWNHNRAVLKYGRLFPRVLSLRYEDLVQKPEVVLRHLLEKMGFSYEPGIHEFWNFDHTDDKLALWDGKPPVRSAWAKDVTEHRIVQVAKTVPPVVAALYEKHPHLKKMNTYFGYE